MSVPGVHSKSKFRFASVHCRRAAARAALRCMIPAMLLVPGIAAAQAIQPGNWDVRSTAVDLVVPGTPAFMLKMAKGKSKTERRCVTPENAAEGIAVVLAPDAKSNCRQNSSQASGGRFEQVLSCTQKSGAPLRVIRTGSYDTAGFTARLIMTGQTSRGAMRVVMDQTARNTARACRR